MCNLHLVISLKIVYWLFVFFFLIVPLFKNVLKCLCKQKEVKKVHNIVSMNMGADSSNKNLAQFNIRERLTGTMGFVGKCITQWNTRLFAFQNLDIESVNSLTRFFKHIGFTAESQQTDCEDKWYMFCYDSDYYSTVDIHSIFVNKQKDRSVQMVTLNSLIDKKNFVVANVHLSEGEMRYEETNELVLKLEDNEEPIMLVGTFNCNDERERYYDDITDEQLNTLAMKYHFISEPINFYGMKSTKMVFPTETDKYLTTTDKKGVANLEYYKKTEDIKKLCIDKLTEKNRNLCDGTTDCTFMNDINGSTYPYAVLYNSSHNTKRENLYDKIVHNYKLYQPPASSHFALVTSFYF